MALYRTYIADVLGALSQQLAWGVQSELAALMSACTSDYEGSWVYFADTSTTVLPNECLVYFMPPGKSIVSYSPNLPTGTPQTSASSGGLTNPNSGASEVYVKWNDKTLLAKLAFHELMHNKLQLGDQMHLDDGLRTGKDINPSTPLTNQNARDMASAIANAVPQWTSGISIITNGINDPLSDFYSP